MLHLIMLDYNISREDFVYTLKKLYMLVEINFLLIYHSVKITIRRYIEVENLQSYIFKFEKVYPF